jgi:thymidylate synthase ThyX
VAGVHKQWANRLLEPFSYTTVIVSATEWTNFFGQRLHKDAQPEMQSVGWAIFEAITTSTPRICAASDWHLPYLQPDEAHLPTVTQIALCVARCARVSYLTHDGKRNANADLSLHDRLLTSGHLSPFEHVAQAGVGSGNFRGWRQARANVRNEANFLGALSPEEQAEEALKRR